jgi:hypothetical protein
MSAPLYFLQENPYASAVLWFITLRIDVYLPPIAEAASSTVA